jgi:hypothetical protein
MKPIYTLWTEYIFKCYSAVDVVSTVLYRISVGQVFPTLPFSPGGTPAYENVHRPEKGENIYVSLHCKKKIEALFLSFSVWT